MLFFNDFAEKLELISNNKSRNKTTEILADFFGKISGEESMPAAYLMIGSLAPEHNPIKFNLAEKQIFYFLNSYLEYFFNPFLKEEFIKNYRLVGDLGQALFLTIKDIHSLYSDEQFLNIFGKLLEMANISGSGSIELKKDFFCKLLFSQGPLVQKYLVRIILTELRLGFSTGTLLDSFAVLYSKDFSSLKKLKKLMEENYNVCADIGLLIYNLKIHGISFLENPRPRIGVPVCPATAERVSTIEDLLIRQPELVVQRKLDGLRLQVHKNKGSVFLFSRNLLNVTEMFPEIVSSILRLPEDNFILDGELLGFNKNTNLDVNFQATSHRRRKHGVDLAADEVPVRIYLFDILMFRGESCLKIEYNSRRSILVNYFENKDPGIILLGELVCSSNNLESHKLITKFFFEALADGYEGIVAKKSMGLYDAGKRGFNWIKIKHLDEHKLNDTVDAVIIGYYYGKGRRAGLGMGAFLVALFNLETNSFQSLAKVGTGLTDDLLLNLTKELDEFIVLEKPENYYVSNELFPNVWVMPKIVVEVEADEITISKLHTAGFGLIKKDCGLAMRFPRLLSVRADKGLKEITTIEELISISRLKAIHD